MKEYLSVLFPIVWMLTAVSASFSFPVDTSPVPTDYIENTPANGEVVAVNPPSFIWRENARATPVPVPPTSSIMKDLPAHPRIFVTPATLSEFRARRAGVAADVWNTVRIQADALLAGTPKPPAKRITLEQVRPLIAKVKTPKDYNWKPSKKTRQQVFWLDPQGEPYWVLDTSCQKLSIDANKASCTF